MPNEIFLNVKTILATQAFPILQLKTKNYIKLNKYKQSIELQPGSPLFWVPWKPYVVVFFICCVFLYLHVLGSFASHVSLNQWSCFISLHVFFLLFACVFFICICFFYSISFFYFRLYLGLKNELNRNTLIWHLHTALCSLTFLKNIVLDSCCSGFVPSRLNAYWIKASAKWNVKQCNACVFFMCTLFFFLFLFSDYTLHIWNLHTALCFLSWRILHVCLYAHGWKPFCESLWINACMCSLNFAELSQFGHRPSESPGGAVPLSSTPAAGATLMT